MKCENSCLNNSWRTTPIWCNWKIQRLEQGGSDFYCHKAALVIEVDGDIHDLQQEEDARREKVLSEMGLRVVRFRNEEVMKDLSAVVGKIREVIGVFLFTSSNRGKIKA